jgi:hypothetical protein
MLKEVAPCLTRVKNDGSERCGKSERGSHSRSPSPAAHFQLGTRSGDTWLTLRSVFKLGLRQTQGLMRSLFGLLELDLAVPDYSTLSRRSKTVRVPAPRRRCAGPLHLLIDSTGLKLGSAGEWLVEKHGSARRRSWRKLHLAFDRESGEVVAAELTQKEVDDGAHGASIWLECSSQQVVNEYLSVPLHYGGACSGPSGSSRGADQPKSPVMGGLSKCVFGHKLPVILGRYTVGA